jgi:hypothetical protein
MTEKAFQDGWAAYLAEPHKSVDDIPNPYMRAPLSDPQREENIGDWFNGWDAAREEAMTDELDQGESHEQGAARPA